jgi:hypothetical protein
MTMIHAPVSYTFSYDELNITTDHLEQLMGYNEPGSCPEPVTDTIEEVRKMGPGLCNIRGGYVIHSDILVDRENKRIFCHDKWFETDKIVTHQLRRSEKAAWFVCTAGEEISSYTKNLMQGGDMIKGYVVDVLANAVVEEAMDRIQEKLSQELVAEGLKITNRYSPGYCNWDIAEQQKLFSLLPEGFLGITLSPSSLMHPMKSVSGIIGIGKEVRFNNYTCNLCSDKNCIYRNKSS